MLRILRLILIVILVAAALVLVAWLAFPSPSLEGRGESSAIAVMRRPALAG